MNLEDKYEKIKVETLMVVDLVSILGWYKNGWWFFAMLNNTCVR